MLKISHLLSRDYHARVCSFLAEPRPAGGRSARAGKIFIQGLILSKRVRCPLTKCKSYSLAKNRRSRPARKRQGHQKARKRRPGARNTAAKKQNRKPGGVRPRPESHGRQDPTGARSGQKAGSPRPHFNPFHKSHKKARPDRTEQRPNAQKRRP